MKTKTVISDRRKLKRLGLLKSSVRVHEIKEDGTETFVSNMSVVEATEYVRDGWEKIKEHVMMCPMNSPMIPTLLRDTLNNAFDNLFRFLGYKPEIKTEDITVYDTIYGRIVGYNEDVNYEPPVDIEYESRDDVIEITCSIRLFKLLKESLFKDKKYCGVPRHCVTAFYIKYNTLTNDIQYEFADKVVPLIQYSRNGLRKYDCYGYMTLLKTSYDDKITTYNINSIYSASKDRDNVYYAVINRMTKNEEYPVYERCSDGELTLLVYGNNIPDISKSVDYSGIDILCIRILAGKATRPDIILHLSDCNMSKMTKLQ